MLRSLHGTETEQQNIPISIRCWQWRVRDTTMWLSSTSAASSTITVNRTAEHTNKDQVFTVASQRHNIVVAQGPGYQSNCQCACTCAKTHTHTHTHTHTENTHTHSTHTPHNSHTFHTHNSDTHTHTHSSSAYSCHKQTQHLRLASNTFNTT
jgi:hypothetical protein